MNCDILDNTDEAWYLSYTVNVDNKDFYDNGDDYKEVHDKQNIDEEDATNLPHWNVDNQEDYDKDDDDKDKKHNDEEDDTNLPHTVWTI